MKTESNARAPWGLRRILLTGLAVTGIAGLFGGLAFAVHDAGLFELDVVNGIGDGNTVNDGAVAGDDWADIFNGTSSAFATSFINDSFANGIIAGFESRTPEVSFFTGGGSKDTACLQDPCDSSLGGAGGPWLYDTVNDVVPDKNDIVTAFAAAYDDPNDQHVIFYFGLDTYAVQGDSNAGFWFFRRPVGLNPLADGETQGTFSGDHTEGDIFVAVAYTGGGKIGEILVYEWDSTLGPGNKPIGLVQIASGADCADAAANDDVCGVVNSTAGEDPPWDYLNKEGETTYKVPAFVEFGLDITALLGDNIGCFSTFLAETRSSQSEEAQLKDFALGAFPVCGIDVNKSDGDLSKVGDEVTYTIDIENTGRATLYKESIIDSLVGDLTDGTNTAIDSSDCGPSLAPGAICTITLSYTVAAGDVVNDTNDGGNTILENLVEIVYTEFDDFTGLAFNESDGHVINLFEPGITFDKSGSPTIIVEGTPVNYTLTLDGASSDDTPLLDCTITDIALGIDQTTELTSSGQVVINASRTWDPAGADAASCVLQVDETYDCTNTAQVSCEVRGFEGINALDEEDAVTVTVIPAAVALTVEKECSPYSKPSNWEGWTEDDKVDYTITLRNRSQIPLNLVAISDSVLGTLTGSCPATLAADDGNPGGPDECVIVTDYAVQGSDDDPLVNQVTVTFNDGRGGSDITTDPVSCTTDLLHPDLTLSKSCASPDPVPAGATANFEIKITNTGDVNLNTNVVDNDFDTPINLDVLLGTAPEGGCLEGDYGDGGTPLLDAADGCLLLEGGITATGTSVSNQVDVTATLPALFDLNNVLTRTASDTCDVQQGDATRTWGFWKTHGSDGDLFDDPVAYGYTCHVFEEHLGGTMNLGWKQVDSCEDLFAIFWAHRSQESDGGRRNKVSRECQTQLRCSGQVAAALLNTGLDNGAPLDAGDLAAVIAALTDGSRRDINQACAPIAAYNESGDDVVIIDLDGAMIPHADPNGTRAEANYEFADCNLPINGRR
jgi:uncharacterized repeat protein (TIGR01451 family)